MKKFRSLIFNVLAWFIFIPASGIFSSLVERKILPEINQPLTAHVLVAVLVAWVILIYWFHVPSESSILRRSIYLLGFVAGMLILGLVAVQIGVVAVIMIFGL
jgi:hypothetical protein